MYYVYIYLNPVKPGKFLYNNVSFLYEPFYVGKGSGNRYIEHLKEAKKKTANSHPKIATIQKIWQANLQPFIVKLDYFLSENDAYQKEADIIKEIGSNYIHDIKNGPLTNLSKDSNPPNHKGKSYEDIYGKDKAAEQRKLRSQLQKEKGGYGPKKHSERTKKLLSQIQKGTGNGHYGKKHSEEAKRKISKANSKTPQWKYKGKYITIRDPDNNVFQFFGSISYFSFIYNLSTSALNKTYYQDTEISKGKTQGWKILSKDLVYLPVEYFD